MYNLPMNDYEVIALIIVCMFALGSSFVPLWFHREEKEDSNIRTTEED
tara:strand:+ start:1340 stop:1483 length:144 start_codon:yes stop_codon:yes gene_type:complete